ncbi:MAG TPA: zinc ribbon domain-containing protein [Acidobacteriaceae bacterium]|nr:zinc ribbon domain-containing protein [Acidobacteriaceae bacterium]
MYCSGCGQLIPPGQQFCPHCGRPVVAAATMPAVPPPYFYTRVHRHIQALSILWIAYAAWTILGWLIAMSIFGGMFHSYFGHWNHGPWGEFPFGQMAWFVPLITVILIGRAVISLITGLALLNRARWARIFAIVVAFLTIIKPITGTALAIYTLWVLLPGASGQEYEQMAGISL